MWLSDSLHLWGSEIGFVGPEQWVRAEQQEKCANSKA